MKICFDARFGSSGGGIARYTRELAKEITQLKSDDKYNILVWDNDDQSLQPSENINVVKLPRKSKNRLPFVWEHVILPKKNFVKECDIFHSPHVVAPLGLDIPLVITAHDLSIYSHPEWFPKNQFFSTKILVPKTIRKAKKIIAVSTQVQTEIDSIFNIKKSKVVVIGEGVSNVFRQKTSEEVFGRVQKKFKIAKTYILFVGIVSPYKNFEVLLKVLGKVDEKVQLVVAGELGIGSKSVKEQIDSYGERVKVLGLVKNDVELASLYQNSLCLVFPSWHESFGLPILEAMASGTPVLTSKVPITRSFQDGAVMIIDPSDPDDIAGKITNILTNKSQREGLVDAGLLESKTYSWGNVIQETLKVYQEVKSTKL